jgi:hypothetical protein
MSYQYQSILRQTFIDNPAHCGCAIFDKSREADLGVEAVVRNDYPIPDIRQSLSQKPVSVFIPFLPGTSVKKDHRWCSVSGLDWEVHIQRLARILAIAKAN